MNDATADVAAGNDATRASGGVNKAERNDGIAKATQGYVLYVILPVWAVAGLADWIFHRTSKIEDTSGTHESLTHSLMMAAIGVPSLMALILEINASTLVALLTGCVLHEGVVIWDVAYASERRNVTTAEQHIHSFLEVLPFMSLSFIVCMHWDQVLGLLGKGPSKASFAIRLKEKPIPPLSLAAIGALLTGLVALPYAEEFIRCYRVDHTVLPHKKPPDTEIGERTAL
jgi:hypothetical protein